MPVISFALFLMLDDVSPGQVLGRYELLVPVAKGGMASVWAARLKGTRGFQKLVAIKTMLPGLVDDPSFERMFLDEATLASQVRHPHVIEIMDLGEQDRILYLVMEWVSGEALSIIMKYAATRGGIPLPIAVHIATQACRGLHAAHELREENGVLVGLVHRDVSPQNVLVTFDGVVKVVDFGVAKATARLDTVTEAGQLKGKIAYMSPEQLRGEKIDRRTDVFAMGILLYMMTTGKHPFRGDDQAQTIARISSDEPAILPSTLVLGYPAGLEACVMQALAKDAAKRYPSANDMLIGLTRALPSAMRESTDEEVSEFIRRLMPDRLDRQRQAIKQALDAADRREMAKSAPQLNMPEAAFDEPATVLEGIGREMTPSADGRSLPGASSTEPPPSFARSEKTRRRTLLLLASGITLIVGAGVGFAFGRDEGQGASAVPPEAPAVSTAPATPSEPTVASPSPPVSVPESSPAEPAPSASASASASAAPTAARPGGPRRPGPSSVTTSKPAPSGR
ncbi:MAG TPA: serine/threonine-protein kinase, partial [Polyangiaceae bacterium]